MENGWKVATVWAAGDGAVFFQSPSAWEWFLRSHRDALVERGELIPGSGRRRSIVGPGIGDAVVEILRREALELVH